MSCPPSHCQNCPSAPVADLERLGLDTGNADLVVALAGNPNTGKSTVFNRLTGLRQHTGNWPGKTISRAEGAFGYGGRRYKIVDLPGTYSLRSASPDETVAREFILFGRPEVTVIVVDASALERNLNLALQVLQVTDRAVLCLNLMDEARAHQIEIDARGLSRELGIPVVPCAARQGEGIPELLREIEAVATGTFVCKPPALRLSVPGVESALSRITEGLDRLVPGLPQRSWLALRLLEGDRSIASRLLDGTLGTLSADPIARMAAKEEQGSAHSTSLEGPAASLLSEVTRLRWGLPRNLDDRLTEALYAESGRICARHIRRQGRSFRMTLQRRVDLLLTSPWTGFPIMGLVFATVLWLTIVGANMPSEMLGSLLMDKLYPVLRDLGFSLLPAWAAGLLIDGMYLASAWVVSVMLPPMAIFFPAFTLLEDLGYLPRVAFNLDRLFHGVGAHGKQALTMAMGYGCNAAGVIAARIIDSPRERLIAIITNNFSLCNGRWPTQILLATVFLGALVPAQFAGALAALAVFGVALLGFALTLASSWLLSRTVLRGQASTFSLELPPYRPPSILRTLYTSLIDRTLFVLWRALVFAVPSGALIWLVANVGVGGHSLAYWAAGALDPLGLFLGLNGIILLAYIIAIPANEIVIPTILMLTVLLTGQAAGPGAGIMFEAGGESLKQMLTQAGWTTLTAVNLMLFSLCHNPCSTTIFTIYKETRSARWTLLATFLPLAIGVLLCGLVAAFA